MFHLRRKSVLVTVAALSFLFPVLAGGQVGTVSEVEKIRAAANTHHASRNTKVSVELKDGRSYKGRVTEVEGEHFVLLDAEAGREVRIRYDSVSKLRKRGMSKAAKTAIWVGAAAGVGALIVFGNARRKTGLICPLGCGL